MICASRLLIRRSCGQCVCNHNFFVLSYLSLLQFLLWSGPHLSETFYCSGFRACDLSCYKLFRTVPLVVLSLPHISHGSVTSSYLSHLLDNSSHSRDLHRVFDVIQLNFHVISFSFASPSAACQMCHTIRCRTWLIHFIACLFLLNHMQYRH